ncbi:MAG: hypothetical protein N2593_01135 [Patescibacteria group bacterium]|nr:hypothetical protein [Patescibacteria group bacterium]
MEKNNIKNIFKKNITDYTYIILFFIFFSIFLFFGIYPALKNVFSLIKERKELKEIDNLYEEKITNIYLIQNILEENRDKLIFVDEAISKTPQVNQMVNDIKKIADKNNFFITKASIADINLSKSKKNIDNINIILEGKAYFDDFLKFINDIINQRRLKMIKNLNVNVEKNSTDSSKLKISLIIEGYYL